MVRNKHNTPGIIKYPFWQMTYENPRAVYSCVNLEEAEHLVNAFTDILEGMISIKAAFGPICAWD